MTIFVADERSREDRVNALSRLAVPPVEPGGPSECP